MWDGEQMRAAGVPQVTLIVGMADEDGDEFSATPPVSGSARSPDGPYETEAAMTDKVRYTSVEGADVAYRSSRAGR
jgi:hypothetical protein